MSHFSCFFFRKRRNKRNQTEREKRRKAPQSRLSCWRNGSFASSAQTVSRRLGETAGTNPVRKSDSTGFACLHRWWAVVVRSLIAARRAVGACERIVRALLTAKMAAVACWRWSFAWHSMRNNKKRRCLAVVFSFLVWGVQPPFQRGLAVFSRCF